MTPVYLNRLLEGSDWLGPHQLWLRVGLGWLGNTSAARTDKMHEKTPSDSNTGTGAETSASVSTSTDTKQSHYFRI